MEKSKTVLHYISFFIIILLIIGILSATSLAKNENGENNGKNNDAEDEKPHDASDKKELNTDKAQKNTQTENGVQEGQQPKEEISAEKVKKSSQTENGVQEGQQSKEEISAEKVKKNTQTENGAQEGQQSKEEISAKKVQKSSQTGNGAHKGEQSKEEISAEKVKKNNQTENGTQEGEKLKEELINGTAQSNSQIGNVTKERERLKEELNIQKNNYQTSKQNFLEIRKQLRSGDYGEKELEITRTYLNSSIDYMIAHLEKVKYNLEQSSDNATENRTATIEDKISQLQKEKEAIQNATDLEDFSVATQSVRGTWNNAKNSVDIETGKTATEKIDKFVNKSEIFSNKIGTEIKSLNATNVNTTDLEAKLASYNALMDSARQKNNEAKQIYNKENATWEELKKANDSLQSAFIDIKNANVILKEIFVELEQYRIESNDETKVENILDTGVNNSENATNTINNSSAVSGIPGDENETYPEGGINSSSMNNSENVSENRSEN